MDVEKLLRFDPYMCVRADLLKRILDKEGQDLDLPQDILWDLALCYRERAHFFADLFADILGVNRR